MAGQSGRVASSRLDAGNSVPAIFDSKTPDPPMRFISLLFSLSLAAGPLQAVSLPAVFSDHMVLQCDRPVNVWGEADAGEEITIRFGEHRATATADPEGQWQAELPAMPASAEPRELVVSGSEERRFRDVLVGEVWLCSGQSNMEKPLGDKRGQRPTDNHLSEIAAARHPRMRLFQVPHHGEVSRPEQQMRWLPCSPESVVATEFSAAGYFFGRELLVNLEVPVGLIHSSFGGTMVEAWTPRAAIEAEPRLEGVLETEYFAWVDGVQATELWRSMVEPLVPYTLRGFLWYQGEANAMTGESAEYATKLATLVKGWRQAWSNPEAPFYYVQLAPFNYSAWDSFPAWLTPRGLPLFWEAQAAALDEIPHSAMIVTTDLAGDGRDIHPTNKRDVGLRLAHLALRETYGDERRVVHSPRVASAEFGDDGRVVLEFEHVGGGLARADGNPLGQFELAGKGRDFHPAEARIVDDGRVEVVSSLVARPVAVRFAWHETATPNLVNSAGLPAVPYRSDDWPVANTREKPGEVSGE